MQALLRRRGLSSSPCSEADAARSRICGSAHGGYSGCGARDLMVPEKSAAFGSQQKEGKTLLGDCGGSRGERFACARTICVDDLGSAERPSSSAAAISV
jgi:hypothetical protein